MTKEFSIQSLLDNVQKRIRALEVLEEPVKHWDTLLLFIIRQKLNNYRIEKWEEAMASVEKPSIKNMTEFLERRAIIESTYNSNKHNFQKKTPFNKEKNNCGNLPQLFLF